jgi:hypothetical protein
MKLETYLEQRGLTMGGFAREHGLSKLVVWRACRWGQIPSKETLDRIRDATGGLVTANDWYGHEPTAEPVVEVPT